MVNCRFFCFWHSMDYRVKTFLMQHTGSRICYLSVRKWCFGLLGKIVAQFLGHIVAQETGKLQSFLSQEYEKLRQTVDNLINRNTKSEEKMLS